MALGMKDPSHWGPQEKFEKATKKTLAPVRTWHVKSGMTDRALSFEENSDVVYTTQSHSTVRKDPYVTIHQPGDEKTTIAGARLDGKGSYHIYLGDPAPDSGVGGQECEVVSGGNTFTRQHRFSPPAEHQDYAWRDTDQYEISIADTKVQSTGRDRKLISLDSEGEEDELIAVYIHNPKASLRNKAQLFWFEKASGEVELYAMAALMGLVERQRKSKDKWNFMNSVGAGAVM